MRFALHEEMIYSYIFHHDLPGARALLRFTGVSGSACVVGQNNSNDAELYRRCRARPCRSGRPYLASIVSHQA